ncbi:MAG: hypothetical protein ACFCBV_13855 [Phycisphaerales bacterium]
MKAYIVLAQAGRGSGQDLGQFLLWVGILIVVVVIGTLGLLMLRRRLGASGDQGHDGFSAMEQMRAMVERGEMSQEEFDQVRKSMAAKIRSDADQTRQDSGPRGEAPAETKRD